MGKGLVIAIVVVVILAIIGTGGFLFLNSRNSSQTTNTEQLITESGTAQTGSSTIKALLGSQSPQVCSFKDMGSQSSGVVYIANGQMRGDFATAGPQGSVTSHMIVSDNTSYVWMDGQTTGFQMSFDPNTATSSDSMHSSVDINQEIDYSCTVWTVDSALFTPPAEISFTSMTMPSGM